MQQWTVCINWIIRNRERVWKRKSSNTPYFLPTSSNVYFTLYLSVPRDVSEHAHVFTVSLVDCILSICALIFREKAVSLCQTMKSLSPRSSGNGINNLNRSWDVLLKDRRVTKFGRRKHLVKLEADVGIRTPKFHPQLVLELIRFCSATRRKIYDKDVTHTTVNTQQA